ncbi:hypothetical protein ACLB2K_031453 [Fragaria x ananassa]
MVRSLLSARFSSRPSSAVKPPETVTLVPKASPSSLLHCWIGGASSGATVRDKSSSKTPPVRIRCRSNFSFFRSPFVIDHCHAPFPRRVEEGILQPASKPIPTVAPPMTLRVFTYPANSGPLFKVMNLERLEKRPMGIHDLSRLSSKGLVFRGNNGMLLTGGSGNSSKKRGHSRGNRNYPKNKYGESITSGSITSDITSVFEVEGVIMEAKE